MPAPGAGRRGSGFSSLPPKVLAPPKPLRKEAQPATTGAPRGAAAGKDGAKPSQMASFMEELRREQVRGGERAPPKHDPFFASPPLCFSCACARRARPLCALGVCDRGGAGVRAVCLCLCVLLSGGARAQWRRSARARDDSDGSGGQADGV